MAISLILQGVVIFVFGAAYEAGCVGFIHYSERGRPFMTSLCSMGAATVDVIGIIASVRDWRLAPFFIVGYGAGSFLAVSWKKRRTGS